MLQRTLHWSDDNKPIRYVSSRNQIPSTQTVAITVTISVINSFNHELYTQLL